MWCDGDVTKVRKYAERKVDEIVRHQVDKVVALYVPAVPHPVTKNGQNGNVTNTENSAVSNHITDFGPSKLPEANDARYRKIEARRRSIIDLITKHAPLTVVEITEKLQGIAKEKPVRTDCNELAEDGRLRKEGTRWCLAILPGIEPATQVNGQYA